MPLALLRPKDGRAVLCGDPKQLGPVVRSPAAAAGWQGEGLAQSLLERFIAHHSANAPRLSSRGLAPAIGATSIALDLLWSM